MKYFGKLSSPAVRFLKHKAALQSHVCRLAVHKNDFLSYARQQHTMTSDNQNGAIESSDYKTWSHESLIQRVTQLEKALKAKTTA